MSDKLLSVKVHHIRGINNVQIDMPLNPDVYAITGVNGIGKSTLLSCIAPRLKRPISFPRFRGNDYTDDSYISFNYDNKSEIWKPTNETWRCTNDISIPLRGFQEGSITSGTRFSHVSSFGYYRKLLQVDTQLLLPADDFVIEKLGYILHNNGQKYSGLLRLDHSKAKRFYRYDGVVYYHKTSDKLVSEFELSTGELLLINLLHLLNNLLVRTNNAEHLNLILIDEIELSLHPAAIKRLVSFSKEIALRYQVAIYFSTHSLEIINELPIDNLFYLQHENSDNIVCQNPCYPAYITRDIYTHSGYDVIILVEDDLAKYLVEKCIDKAEMDRNKRIQVLPVGGYDNTLDLHQNLLEESVLTSVTHIISIIDGDVENDVRKKCENEEKWNNISSDCILFLPINSLEKYLKHELFDIKNYRLMRAIRDRFFAFESEPNWFENDYVANIRNKQKSDKEKNISLKDDKEYFKNGKNLFAILTSKYVTQGKGKREFRQQICNFIADTQNFSAFEQQLGNALNQLFIQ